MRKTLAYIFILSISMIVVDATDLSDYPEIFIEDNKYNGLLVIGNTAPAEDVIGIADIAISLKNFEEGRKIEVGYTRLSDGVQNIKNQNAIIVGNLCTNDLIADFVSGSCVEGKDTRFNENESSILFFNNNGKYQVIVGGHTPQMTRIAANHLAQENKLFGKEIIISGDKVISEVSLSSYPNIFLENGEIDVTMVVGKDGSPTDVIAMTNIITSLTRDKPNKGKNKLDNEIKDPFNKNIISIGNPCNNNISYELLGESVNCESYTEPGKAYLKLLKNGYKHQLIVASYSDKGTRKISDVLVNYENYNLNSDYYEVDYEIEDTNVENVNDLVERVEKKKEEEKKKEVTEGVILQKENNEVIEGQEASQEKVQETDKVIIKKEKGLFNKIWNWFKDLFGIG